MDQQTRIIKEFETILKENLKNKSSSLYRNVKNHLSNTNRPQDVIKIVSSQMKAIQEADRYVNTKDLDKHSKPNVLTQDKLSVYDKVLNKMKPGNKFETQCVTDTQLIDIANVAEALDADQGATEHLNVSITVSDLEKINKRMILDDHNAENETKCVTSVVKTGLSNCKETTTDTDNIPNRETIDFDKSICDHDALTSKETNSIADVHTFVGFTEDFVESDKDIFDENYDECVDDFDANRFMALSPILNKIEPIKTVYRGNSLQEREKERSVSPIFNIKSITKSKSPSPLVFNLDCFEKFEQVAIPLIEENIDLETTKHLINSQILDKELFLPSKTAKAFTKDEQMKYLDVETNVGKSCCFIDKAKTTIINSHIDDKRKQSSAPEDEILFSSDEEGYEHKVIQDLPLTCALESSFCEQPDILDKTMYVGFQTASNKSIQVCTESFTKAKSILNEVSPSCKEEFTLTEMVNIYDSACKKESEEVKEKSVHTIELCNKENDGEDNFSPNISMFSKIANVPTKKDFNNKSSIKNANENTQFPDIDICMLDQVISNVSQSDNGTYTYQKVNSNMSQCLKVKKTPETKKFAGFTTASNEAIKLSDVAIARCQKVFQDIDLDEKYETTDQEHTNNNTEKAVISSKENMSTDINDEIILQEFENIDMSVKHEVKEELPFIGFKTASPKSIIVSDKAAEKAKRLFEDIEINSNDGDGLKEKFLSKLCTETNNNCANDRLEIKNLTSNVIFKTTSNKDIKISNQAFAKTKNLFHDIELDSVNGSADFHQIREIKDDNRGFEEVVKPSTSTGYTGFQTANNKIIVISDEALLKTKNIFKDIDDPIDKLKNEKQKQHRCGPKKEIHNSTIDVAAHVTINHDQNFVGFQTVSHKPVPAYANALKKSKEIRLDDSSESRADNEYTPKTVKSRQNITFQTANNKAVTIPKKALERTKKIFQKLDSEESSRKLNDELKSSNSFGFKTANNKEVIVSEHALLKTNQIFNDFDLNDNNNRRKLEANDGLHTSIGHPFQGFQTASNKDVKVSKVALDKCKKIFQDIEFSNDFKKQNNIAKPDERDTPKSDSMCGFKTANNMPVCVSKEALARSKRLFDDIDDMHINTIKVGDNAKTNSSKKELYLAMTDTSDNESLIKDKKYYDENICNIGFGGFKTASNKKVNISEQALAKSKQIFEGIDMLDAKDDKIDENGEKNSLLADTDYRNAKRFKPNNSMNIRDSTESVTLDINKENLADIINTQVLNNFEDTFYSEDFRRETPSRNKRSASPILSCPKAKRRRFETPFKAKVMEIEETAEVFVKPKENIFDENYKNNKIYKLKDINRDEPHYFDPYLTDFGFDTLLNFEFEGIRNEISENKIDVGTIKETFLTLVNKKLVPDGWLDNHIKIILWKLISYEVVFRKSLGVVCTVKNLLNQLKYRYDKELYNAERTALRKILEKDDVPSKTMVLCVVAIYADGVKVDSVTNIANVELLLTDGWYCIMATIDKMLTQLVVGKKIVVGTKLATNGAELLNCEGIAPWEDTSSVRLKIFGNSTRRARWDARLGYHGNGAILSHLSNVSTNGGKVSKLRLYVIRVYPALYVEKFDDGSTVTRSERLEHLYQAIYEVDRQNLLEKLYEEVEKEFSDVDSQDSENTCDDSKICYLQSGSQIYDAFRKSKDPSDMRIHLTSTQKNLLEEHARKRHDKYMEKVQSKLIEKIDKHGLKQARNVVTVLKARVAGIHGEMVTKGLLSVWKPNDAILDLMKEDSWIEVMNVVPTAYRYSEIQISAGRQSVLIQSKFKGNDKTKQLTNTLKRKCCHIKELYKNNYTEIDTVGLIFLIEPSCQYFDSKSHFQNVYLTDKERNILCVNFWGGLQKFGFENVLDTGQIVACINLQKRAGNTRNILQYRATEFTYFTKTPKSLQAKQIIDDFNSSVLDRRKLCEECITLKNNFTIKSNVNITPYRMNIGNKLDPNFQAELNLTGLDFESSFRQKDELSPKTLKRKQEVNKRIDKLKMYGEPPPLTPIHIINKSKNALSSYKSPMSDGISPSVARNLNIGIVENATPTIPRQDTKSLMVSDVSPSVAQNIIDRNVENVTPTIFRQNTTSVASKSGLTENKDSPVTSVNKTYVKSSVNPVRLNFDNNDLVDHFAGEFEDSPPLSLD